MRKKISRLTAPVAVSATLLLSLPTVRAQQLAAATLRGVVTDPQGAVIPGATVKATNTAAAEARETTTNGEGVSVLSNLPPGDYELRVEASGFTPKTSKDPIRLQ